MTRSRITKSYSAYGDKPYKGHNEQYPSCDDKPTKPHQYYDYDKSGKPVKNHKPSNAELLSRAKLVADAAKATLNSDHDKVDKTKVAHAAGDLLNAASHYGKLDEKGYGEVLGKAEDYLHNYNDKPLSTDNHSSSHSGHAGHDTKPTSSDDHSGYSGSSKTNPSGGHKDSGGGYGDYLKIAQGLIKKH